MAMNHSGGSKTATLFTNESTGLRSDNGPYIGVVMDNRDPTRSGRVDVWLKTHAGDKEDPANWRTVSYLSPFYGSTPFKYNDKTESKFDQNGHTYGMWFTSPDLGVEVLCFFVDGNPNSGYYVGYVPQIQMNHMIPATGARTTSTKSPTQTSALADAEQLPVVEMSQSTENHNNADFYNVDKPVHSVLAGQLWQQGTLTDKVRGPIGTSVQRESPSYAYGVNTPGRPVYSGGFTENNSKDAVAAGEMNADNTKVEARRGGHSFVMDDGDLEGNDVLMRLRTATGHQITMSDDGGCIYVQHANGMTWFELGNDGTIDLYAMNSINLRTQGELNFHADNNINFFSGKSINMFATENIKLEADKEFDVIGKQKVGLYSEAKVLVKSDGILSTDSAQNTTILAGGNLIETGALIQFNTTTADSVQAPEFITPTSLPDASQSGATGWKSAPGALKSIVTRAPTHEPYPEHNKGVPIPVKLGAPVVPAPEPAPAKTQEKIEATATQPPPLVPAQVADVAKQANDTNTTAISNMTKASVVSTLSQQSQLVSQAVDVVSEKGLGKFGIQPKMLEDLGIIKPGIIDIASESITSVFDKLKDPAMFTSALGINSLDDLLNSENIQSSLMQTGMEQANELLKQSGILTGAESAFETASILGTAMVATPSEIVDWVSGKGDSALNNLITEASKASQYAVSLVEGPGKEVIDNITSGITKASGLAKVGNIDRAAIDAATDSIIGSVKIPSAESINTRIKDLASGTVDDAVDDALGSAKEIITRFV